MADQKKTRRAMLEELLAKRPEDAFARYGLAMECMNNGDPAAADAHFRHLLEHNAGYVPAYLMYGQFLVRERREDQAKKVLTTGMAAAEQARNEHARGEMQTLLGEIG